MEIGSMKEVFLTRARDAFLFDCRAGGLEPDIVRTYQNVLESFIRFTGNIRIKKLTPELVRMYLANLSDGPNEGDEHERLVMRQAAMIHTWIHWMQIQKYISERTCNTTRLPGFTSLIPSRINWSLAHYWKYPLSV